jgi:hypothetical protein
MAGCKKGCSMNYFGGSQGTYGNSCYNERLKGRCSTRKDCVYRGHRAPLTWSRNHGCLPDEIVTDPFVMSTETGDLAGSEAERAAALKLKDEIVW